MEYIFFFAVDSVEDRLEEAENLGAIPLTIGRDDVQTRVLEATENRGADGVIEVGGNTAALRSAFDLLRPCGVLSCVGFPQEELPFSGLECYQKNIRYAYFHSLRNYTDSEQEKNSVNIGRVPVRTVFHDALECLKENQEKLCNYVTHEFSLADVAKGFEMFEQRKARKVLLKISE